MIMDARLQRFSAEARALLEAHQDILLDVPAAFRPLLVRQLRAWESLFPPERESLTRILKWLQRSGASERETLFRPFKPLTLPDAPDLDPIFEEEKLLERCLRHFKKEGTYQTWRLAVDDVFQRVTAGGSAEAAGPKFVFVTLGEGTSRVQTLDDTQHRFVSYFWNHLEPLGTLFTSLAAEPAGSAGAPFVSLFRSALGSPQIKVWAIETGTALKPSGDPAAGAIWFSFEQLRPVLDRITRKIADTMLAGVSGPEALYSKITDFKIEELGLPTYQDSRIQKLIEQVILQGSGALVINNTFAEWAAVQALRRVEPDLLMVRFGQRRRFVPLRQLDPFQQPRPGSEDLPAEDSGGSLQDADVLTYYIWLETRKNPRYKDRTYFLIHLEGSRAALFIGPGIHAGKRIAEPARFEDIVATTARLIGVDPAGFGGRILQSALVL